MADPENDHGFIYLEDDNIADIDLSPFFDVGFGDDTTAEDYVNRISSTLAETIDARLGINLWHRKFHSDSLLHPSYAAFRHYFYRVDPVCVPPTTATTEDSSFLSAKKTNLADIGIVGGLGDGSDEKERVAPPSTYMGRAMGAGSGLGRTGFSSSTTAGGNVSFSSFLP